jgi:energy-converting hydrogenase Eha subunit H
MVPRGGLGEAATEGGRVIFMVAAILRGSVTLTFGSLTRTAGVTGTGVGPTYALAASRPSDAITGDAPCSFVASSAA